MLLHDGIGEPARMMSVASRMEAGSPLTSSRGATGAAKRTRAIELEIGQLIASLHLRRGTN